MKTLALFGGSGGLGKKLTPLLNLNYKVMSLSSKDVDISNYDEVHNFFKGNFIDIVINASGANYDAFLHKISKNDIDKIKNTLEINVLGNINVLSGCLPYMRSQKYGRVILMSSVLAENSPPGTAIYSGCKSFIDRLAKSASTENISKGVTCNSIRLGYFDGGLLYKIPENIRENIKETIGLKRWGRIDELHKTIEFVINNEYITGANLSINGGMN